MPRRRWAPPRRHPAHFSPQQIRAAYGINLLSQQGAGQTIAIVDAYDDPDLVSSTSAAYATSDLHNFDAYYGLPDFGSPGGPTFTKLSQSGGINYPGTEQGGGDWEQEEAADVEWAHAIAPEANIVLIESSSYIYGQLIEDAVNTAVNIASVSVVSMSFGAAETPRTGFFMIATLQHPPVIRALPSWRHPVTRAHRSFIRRLRRMSWP